MFQLNVHVRVRPGVRRS